MATGSFRRAALERFSTPDRLDQPVRIVAAWAWTALAALLLILAAGTIASIVMTVSEKIPGKGIVIAQTGILEIPFPEAGRLLETRPRIGDQVRRGDVVALIENATLRRDLDVARKAHHDAEEQRRQVTIFHTIAAQARTDADQRRQRDLELTVTLIRKRLALLQERASPGHASPGHAGTDQNVGPHVIATGTQPQDARMAIWSAEEDLAAIQRLSSEIDLATTLASIHDRREQLELDLKVEGTARQAALIEEQVRRSEEVVSPYSGIVVELKHDQGRLIQKGAPLLTLLPGASAEDAKHAGPLRVVLFVPATDGKRIVPGMAVEISPSGFPREEHGFMQGRVARVADMPMTEDGMLHLLKNAHLAASLLSDGPPLALDVELVPDPQAPSGFAWSSPSGPAATVGPGTLATGHVRVRNRRLIEFVVPATRVLFAGKARPPDATAVLGYRRQ